MKKLDKTSRVVCGDKFINLINDINEKMGFGYDAIARNLVFDIDGFICVNPNIMHEDEISRKELSNIVLELMEGKSLYIKHKYLSLHKMLINKEVLHIPSSEELNQMTKLR